MSNRRPPTQKEIPAKLEDPQRPAPKKSTVRDLIDLLTSLPPLDDDEEYRKVVLELTRNQQTMQPSPWDTPTSPKRRRRKPKP